MAKKRKRGNKTNYKLLIIFIALLIVIFVLGIIYTTQEKKPVIEKQYLSLKDRDFIFLKNNSEKSPVIIVLHGTGQDYQVWFQQNPQATFVQKAVEEGYAIIAPDSKSPFCEGVKQWDFSKNSTDLDFFDDIFNWIWLRQDLDSDRIYVAGISNGGYMASRLAEERGSNIKAVIIHSAGHADNALANNQSCYVEYQTKETTISPNHPRTMLIHGTNDTIIPYQSSISYFDSLKKTGKGVVLIPKIDADHFWFEDYDQIMLNWFS